MARKGKEGPFFTESLCCFILAWAGGMQVAHRLVEASRLPQPGDGASAQGQEAKPPEVPLSALVSLLCSLASVSYAASRLLDSAGLLLAHCATALEPQVG